MELGEPKIPTPEEIAKTQKERALSDAELIKDGAEYVVDEKGTRLDVASDAAYTQIEEAKKEMKQEKIDQKSPKIELPKDPEIVQKLQSKLKEYKQRLEEKKLKMDEWAAPEQVFPMLVGTKYKIAVLEKVLKDGEIKTFKLSRELEEQDGQFDKHAFNNACTVIEDYCKTGGKNIRGGTGL